jgi:RecB family exonuclease
VAKPVVLSPSALDRYRACPRQFLLADLERRPRREAPSESLVIANAVHEALELFFGLEPEERDPLLLEMALRHAWPRHRRGVVFLSREHEAAVGRSALELVEGYCMSFDTSVGQIARETRVSFPVAPRIVVAGRVDRVELVPDDREPPDPRERRAIEVIDYKTGSRVADEQELLWDPAVQIYVLGAARRFDRPVRAVRLQYLRHGHEVRVEVDEEVEALLRRRLARTIAELRADTEWQAVVDMHCNWCPVEEHCSARSQVRREELQPVEGMPF